MTPDTQPNVADLLSARGAELEERLASGTSFAARERVDLKAEFAWELRKLDPCRSEREAREAHALATDLDYRRGIADSLLTLGFVAIRKSRYEEAHRDVEEARRHFEALGDRRGEVRARNLLGMLCGERGDLAAALENFLENQRLCDDLGDRAGAADALNNAALVTTYLSDYASALEFYYRALDHYQELDDPESVARTRFNIGLTHLEMGRFQEAFEHLQRTLESDAIRADVQLQALTHLNLGRALRELGAVPSALHHVTTSLERFEALGDDANKAHALDTLGLLYRDLGEPDKARVQFQQALRIERSVGDRMSQAKTRLELARLLLVQGATDEAPVLLRQALADAEAVGNRATVFQAHRALAEAHQGRGELTVALEHFRAYMTVKDEVFNEVSEKRRQALEVAFRLEQAEKEREIYRLRNIELVAANEEKSRLLERLARQANEDVLTGLYNRRYFDATMGEAFAQARRTGAPLGVLLGDIDHFKGINDRFGHQVGDRVLVAVARLLQGALRGDDTVARYGGEEFIALLPGLSPGEGLRCGERLRAAIEGHDWSSVARGLVVTMSIGVTGDLGVDNFERMIACADAHLYHAKRSGRNRIEGDAARA